jgi:hypothetical protein
MYVVPTENEVAGAPRGAPTATLSPAYASGSVEEVSDLQQPMSDGFLGLGS